MSDMKFSIVKGYERDEIAEKYPEFGCTEWMVNNYEKTYRLPKGIDLDGFFPSIEIWEKYSSKAPEELPIFVVCFNTCFFSQAISIYDVIDLYELVQNYLPLCEKEEHSLWKNKTDKEFNNIIKSNQNILKGLTDETI